jgi:uncharacterized membrane protein
MWLELVVAVLAFISVFTSLHIRALKRRVLRLETMLIQRAGEP